MTDTNFLACVHSDLLPFINLASDEELAQFVRAQICVALGNELPQIDGLPKALFEAHYALMERLAEAKRKKSEDGRKGGNPSLKQGSTEVKQGSTEVKPDTDTVSEYIKNSLPRARESSPEKSFPQKTPLPETFDVSAEMEQWAKTEVPGVDVVLETKKFRAHYKSHKSQRDDWVAAWQKWILQALEFKSRAPTGKSPPNESKVGLFMESDYTEPELIREEKPVVQPEEWKAALEILGKSVSGKCFDTWFRPIVCRSVSKDAVELEVPTEMFRNCLNENYMPQLFKATGCKKIDIRRRGS